MIDLERQTIAYSFLGDEKDYYEIDPSELKENIRGSKLSKVISDLLDMGTEDALDKLKVKRSDIHEINAGFTDLVGYDEDRSVIYALYNWEEKFRLPEIVEDIELEEVTVLNRTWTRLHLDSGLLEILWGEDDVIDQIGYCMAYLIFRDLDKFQRIEIDSEGILKWIKWGDKLMSATFTEVEDGFEKVFIKGEDISEKELYKKLLEIGKLSSATIRMTFRLKDEIEATVTVRSDGRITLYRYPSVDLLDKLSDLVWRSMKWSRTMKKRRRK